MNFTLCLKIFALIFSYLLKIDASKNRVQDEIYVNLNVKHHCFRILNGTHVTGCQSPEKGSIGVIQLVENDLDLNYVLSDPDKRGPFIIAMFINVFRNQKFIHSLQKSGHVTGMLILHRSHDKLQIPPDFSEDETCPNRATSLYSNDSSSWPMGCGGGPQEGGGPGFKWNPKGTGLRFIDWQMPIIYIRNETEIDLIVEKCFNKMNKEKSSWPYCAAELSTFYSAAVSSVTCLRRNNLFPGLNPEKERFCDPLTGRNVYAFLPPTNKSRPLTPESVVVLAARLDSFSLFYETNPAIRTSMVDIVAILSIAEALGRNLALFKSQNKRHLMLVLYDGESLDYIGSSRMVWDMTNDRFPAPLGQDLVNQSALFNLSNIDLLLELNQLIPKDPKNPQFYTHLDPESYKNPRVKSKLDRVVDQLIKISGGKINGPDSDTPLPPASAQSFLKINRHVPSLVIANHKTEYENRFYNSFLDLPENLYDGNLDTLKNALLTILNPVLNFVVDFTLKNDENSQKIENYNQNLTIDEKILSQLLECFLSYPVSTCNVFQAIWDSIGLRNSVGIGYRFVPILNQTLPRNYIGLNNSDTGIYAHSLMSYFLGDKIPWSNRSISECWTGPGGPFTQSETDQINSYWFFKNLFDWSRDTNESFCSVGPVRQSLARSPAFEIADFDLTSNFYSTWTESLWNQMSLRLFLKPSRKWEICVFLAGFLTLTISLIFGFLISKTTDTLFACNVTAL